MANLAKKNKKKISNSNKKKATNYKKRSHPKQNKKSWWLLSLIFLLLMCAGLFLFFNQEKPNEFDNNAKNYNDPIKKGSTWTAGDLIFPGFGEVPVNEQDKNIKITLGNSSVNEAYLQYNVSVNQGEKDITILDTKLIKPGNAITEISTEKLTMKKGRYPMVITIKAYSLKNTKAPLNVSTIDSTLVIE